jgi:transposase
VRSRNGRTARPRQAQSSRSVGKRRPHQTRPPGDRQSRFERIEAAEQKLAELPPKLNRAHLKRQGEILKAANNILQHYRVGEFIQLRLQTHMHVTRKRPRGRPPGRKAEYRTSII